MAEKIKRITYKDRNEWLELRKKGIGGSDAATIVGLNKYSSPYLLWLDKLGKLNSEDKYSEAARQGTDLEQYVAERFCQQTGKKVHKVNAILKNPKYPFAQASVDRKVQGENAYLECKTINPLRWMHYKNEDFPESYLIQILHYFAVTGCDKFYLAILVLGTDFIVHEFNRKDLLEEIDNLMEKEKDFWELVQTETPPEVDGTEPTDKALQYMFDNPIENSKINLFGMNKKANQLAEMKLQEKELKTNIKMLEQEFKEAMGPSTTAETDEYVFTWKPQVTKRFQSKAFMKDHPDLDYDSYFKETSSRVFKCRQFG